MDRAFLKKAEDANGLPAPDFERFYQQGLSCFAWRLPQRLVSVAFKREDARRWYPLTQRAIPDWLTWPTWAAAVAQMEGNQPTMFNHPFWGC